MGKIFIAYSHFFQAYGILFAAILLTTATGIIAGPIAYLLAPVILLALYTQKSYRKSALLYFFFVLIMSDSLKPYFQFFKILRIECIVILFLLALRYLLSRKAIDRNVLYILPFIVSLFIALSYSPTLLDSGLRTLSYLFLPVIVFHLYKEEILVSKGGFVRDLVLLGSVVIVVGHLLFLVAPGMVKSYGEGDELRISGLFGNPNGLAIFSFLLFPITLYLGRLRLLDKATLRFLIFLLVFSILVSGARTALGGILIFSAYWGINRYNLYIRTFLKLVIPALFLIAATIGVQLLSSSAYLSTRLRLDTLESAGGRIESWRWGYAQIPKHLYFGRGLLYDSYAYQAHFPASLRAANRGLNAAFSGVLALLLDVGVVGTLAFVFFIIISFSRFKDKQLVVPLLLAMLLSWTFESWIVATLNPFTIIFFIFIVLFQKFSKND